MMKVVWDLEDAIFTARPATLAGVAAVAAYAAEMTATTDVYEDGSSGAREVLKSIAASLAAIAGIEP